eukprot:6848407-Pyramimonas_sp.AAC.1
MGRTGGKIVPRRFPGLFLNLPPVEGHARLQPAPILAGPVFGPGPVHMCLPARAAEAHIYRRRAWTGLDVT